jgi:hypothetical protein
MTPARKPLSKKTRFEVFKRDGFKCMYCGAHPPEAVLEADHIKPVAEGGSNRMDNLVTACFACNRGKAARSLDSVPQGLADKAEAVKEREAQIKGYEKVMSDKRLRLDREAWSVLHLLLPDAKSAARDWLNSLRSFIDKLGFNEVREAMEIALAKSKRDDEQTWRYFCGVCWTKLRRQEGTDGAR